MTWADDGHLYAAWGDGGGFGGTNSKGRVLLGVARIEGEPDTYTGHFDHARLICPPPVENVAPVAYNWWEAQDGE